MDLLEIVIIIIAVATSTAVTVSVLIGKKFRDIEEIRKGDSGLNFLNQNIQALEQSLNYRLDGATRIISDVTRELGQMQQIGSDLKNFQEFLKSPKLRGNLGEQGLKEILSQTLPRKYYKLQFSFLGGQIVDALVYLEAGKIPIDAKFPLENFNAMLKAAGEDEKNYHLRKFKNDFRLHVQAIAKKYINPDEGTVDFAFMYLPSESIFFEVINNKHDLFEYAANNHIIVSSPSTFFYYLRTIMLGLEGRKITEMSREILKVLSSIKKDSRLLGESMGVLNRHITNSAKTISTANNYYNQLSTKIAKIDILEQRETESLEPGSHNEA